MGPKKKEEAEANNGMSTYYLSTFFMFGLLSIYCFNFYSKWGGSQCMIDDSLPTMDGAEPAPAAEEAAPAEETAGGARRSLYDTLRL